MSTQNTQEIENNLAILNYLFEVKPVDSSRGPEDYFCLKATEISSELWTGGMRAIEKIFGTVLEEYSSGLHGNVYRLADERALSRTSMFNALMTAYLAKQGAVRMAQQVAAETKARAEQMLEQNLYQGQKEQVMQNIASLVVVYPYTASEGQESYCFSVTNKDIKEEQMKEYFKNYFDVVSALSPTVKDIVYYTANPRDERLLKFAEDIMAYQKVQEAQKALVQQSAKPRLCVGAAASQAVQKHHEEELLKRGVHHAKPEEKYRIASDRISVNALIATHVGNNMENSNG